MAVTTTWAINDMTRNVSDGGVTEVRWSCIATNDSGNEQASTGGKLACTPDPDADEFIQYNDLTESVVLGWVKADLPDGETAAELETRLTDKVNNQITRNAAIALGVPW